MIPHIPIVIRHLIRLIVIHYINIHWRQMFLTFDIFVSITQIQLSPTIATHQSPTVCSYTFVLSGKTVKEQLIKADSNNAEDCVRKGCANLFDRQVKTWGNRVTVREGQIIASETFFQ